MKLKERIDKYAEETKLLATKVERRLKELSNKWGPFIIVPLVLQTIEGEFVVNLETISSGLRRSVEAAVFAAIMAGDEEIKSVISRFEKEVKEVLLNVEELKIRINVLEALKKRKKEIDTETNNRGH